MFNSVLPPGEEMVASVFNEVITNDMAANLAPFLAPALLIAVSSCNHERVRVGLREQDSPKCTDCCRSTTVPAATMLLFTGTSATGLSAPPPFLVFCCYFACSVVP
jgi:hypothetical protein